MFAAAQGTDAHATAATGNAGAQQPLGQAIWRARGFCTEVSGGLHKPEDVF